MSDLLCGLTNFVLEAIDGLVTPTGAVAVASTGAAIVFAYLYFTC